MAFAAIGAAAALAGAGAGIYGASQAGAAQRSSNQMNAQALAENRRVNTANALQDAINSYENLKQRAIDNQRYDEAKAIEDRQRDFINQLSTATTIDADGNTLRYDPSTGTWSTLASGVALDTRRRKQEQSGRDYSAALVDSITGGQQLADRRSQGGGIQGQERLLGAGLLGRYAANQGRSPESMEGALISKNVAEATDALQRNGGMAQLQGWRQGNSGSDALIGALARTGQTGTRSAIANARYAAPQDSYNERDMAAKSLLGPANTLTGRGTADPGTAAPVYSGDASSNLMATLQRGNPAGVGTTLSPRAGGGLPVQGRPGAQTAFTPLNAHGTEAFGVQQALSGLKNNSDVQSLVGAVRNWWNGPQTPATTGIQYSPQSAYQQTDRNW